MTTKKLILAAILALAPLTALAQPGPGPAPSPWVVNGPQISYSNGCVTIPVTVAGGCKGAGTINVGGFYVNGASVAGGVSSVFGRTGAVVGAPGDYSVGQVTGAAPIAGPTFTGTVTIPNGGVFGTPTSLTLTNATGLVPSSGLAATGTPSSSTYLRGDNSWAAVPAGGVTSVGQTFTGGLISVAGSPITTSGTLALTVAGTSGGIPYFSGASTWASSGALAANALMIGGGAGVAPSTTTTGSGILTFLGTPSSLNLAAALTDETGTGSAVFANGPTLIAPVLGTIASGDASNLTNIPVANATGILPAVNGGAGSITGILYANGSGTNAALTIGSGLSLVGSTLSATGSGVTITPTSGNVAGDVVCMQNTTTVIQDCGFSATAIPTNNLTTTLNAKTGAYTIATTDAGKINYLNSASPFTFTVPAGATLGAGFATDIGNANTGLLTSTLASGTWADTGNASITTVQGQELFTWVGASNNVHSWVSMPPLVAHGIVANNTANKDYGTSFNNSNVTALLAGNLAAINAANTFSAAQANCITTLTAVSNVFTPDGTCNNYVLTLGATNTLANWSAGMTPGVSGWIRVNQDATGGRTIGTYGSQINSPGGTASNTFSAGANAWDTYSYLIYDSTHVWFAPAGLNASH